jgi:GH24 family phage-related lysozyme (muramidase)
MMPAALPALIRRFEGYAKRLASGACTTYLCSAGVVTIGYGSTGRGVWPGMVWSKTRAEQRLQTDLSMFAGKVAALSPSLEGATEGQQAAIISMAYNCGLAAYRDSTLRKCVNRDDWEGAKRQLLRWDKVRGKPVRGLTIRRQAEAELL